MVFIQAKMPKGLNDAEKTKFLKAVTQVTAETLSLPAESVSVVIEDDYPMENWMIGGKRHDLLASSLEKALSPENVAGIPSKKIDEQVNIKHPDDAEVECGCCHCGDNDCCEGNEKHEDEEDLIEKMEEKASELIKNFNKLFSETLDNASKEFKKFIDKK